MPVFKMIPMKVEEKSSKNKRPEEEKK